MSTTIDRIGPSRGRERRRHRQRKSSVFERFSVRFCAFASSSMSAIQAYSMRMLSCLRRPLQWREFSISAAPVSSSLADAFATSISLFSPLSSAQRCPWPASKWLKISRNSRMFNRLRIQPRWKA
eukprot:scaffold1439_cov282-Pinguiococcus_pyrenoidosus.AAC.8